ncbi:MAG TPA: DNA-binding protein [Polyangia bacterium]|jgi:hypothetical protein
MRKLSATALAAFVVVTLLTSVTLAQHGGGWGPLGQHGKLYDPKSVVTTHGSVTVVERFTPLPGMGPGIHMTVETKQGLVDVHLGPAWYVEQQAPKLAVGDRVAVTGSRITLDGKPTIIAAAVSKGGATLRLRDVDSGVPVWSGGRRARGGR